MQATTFFLNLFKFYSTTANKIIWIKKSKPNQNKNPTNKNQNKIFMSNLMPYGINHHERNLITFRRKSHKCEFLENNWLLLQEC